MGVKSVQFYYGCLGWLGSSLISSRAPSWLSTGLALLVWLFWHSINTITKPIELVLYRL